MRWRSNSRYELHPPSIVDSIVLTLVKIMKLLVKVLRTRRY
jgi:hypothetical protein